MTHNHNHNHIQIHYLNSLANLVVSEQCLSKPLPLLNNRSSHCSLKTGCVGFPLEV